MGVGLFASVLTAGALTAHSCHSDNHSLAIARSSGCGSDRWVDALAAQPRFLGASRRLTYFNIGANPGVDMIPHHG